MSAEAVADSGVEPIMARAIAQRLRWKESLGLKDHFKGLVPATYQEALEAMAREGGAEGDEAGLIRDRSATILRRQNSHPPRHSGAAQ